jgi:hypothetical protein
MFLSRTVLSSAVILSLTASIATRVEADSISCSPGFNNCAGAITVNGSAVIISGSSLLRLTDNFGQAGSAFSDTPVNITQFKTSFVFQLHGGTFPVPADGITFTIQANGPTALGGGGNGQGYEGIGRSVAIKFDTFNNAGETNDSTGLFTDGASPDSPGSIILNPCVIALQSESVKRADLSYDGTTLRLTITDLTSLSAQTENFPVNIPAFVGANSAFVGFTGGTGASFSVQDITSWTFTSPTLAVQAIERLKGAVQALVEQGVALPADGQPLLAKLDAAIVFVKANDVDDAVGTLQAFINQVEAFIHSGRLTPAQGQSLIDAATAIIQELG